MDGLFRREAVVHAQNKTRGVAIADGRRYALTLGLLSACLVALLILSLCSLTGEVSIQTSAIMSPVKEQDIADLSFDGHRKAELHLNSNDMAMLRDVKDLLV